MKNTLIICYGNDLIGNDAFGRAVYDALPKSLNKLSAHQLLPELLEEVLDVQCIVFVDASIGEGDTDSYEIHAQDEGVSNFHHLTPPVFLSLLKSIYQKTPKAFVYTAYFKDFELDKLDSDFDEKVTKIATMVMNSHSN